MKPSGLLRDFGDVSIERNRSVLIIQLKKQENRMDGELVRHFNACLDIVESEPLPLAVVTVGTGRFFSTGLDLPWLATQSPEGVEAFVADFKLLLLRILTFPRTTIAALNGHTVGAGCMLALAHDYRVMDGRRGWLRLPLRPNRISISQGTLALLTAKVPDPRVVRDVVLSAQRLGALEALRAGIVDLAVDTAGMSSPDSATAAAADAAMSVSVEAGVYASSPAPSPGSASLASATYMLVRSAADVLRAGTPQEQPLLFRVADPALVPPGAAALPRRFSPIASAARPLGADSPLAFSGLMPPLAPVFAASRLRGTGNVQDASELAACVVQSPSVVSVAVALAHSLLPDKDDRAALGDLKRSVYARVVRAVAAEVPASRLPAAFVVSKEPLREKAKL